MDAISTILDAAPPVLSRSLIVSNVLLMIGWLVVASVVPPFCWHSEAPIDSVFGTMFGLLFASFALVGYGVLTRRRRWIAEGAAKTLLFPIVLLVPLSVLLPVIFILETPVRGARVNLLLLGCACAIALAVTICGYRINVRWAEELAFWEGRCRRQGIVPAGTPWRVSLRELLAFLVVAAAVLASWKALGP